MRIAAIITLIFLSQCTSTPVEKFKQVKVGMTKGDVLDIMGSPASTSQKGGLLRWYYNLNPTDPSSRRVLYFDEGLVTYRGPIIPPPLTAEEADELKMPKEEYQEVQEQGDYEPSMTDDRLREVIKKDLQKRKKKSDKKAEKFEEI